MRRSTVFGGGLAAAVIVALLALPSFSEEGGVEQGPGDPMQAYWVSLGKRNENHDWMAFMEGTFDAAAKFWMGPGEPMESKGRATNSWAFGKRFIRMQYVGETEGQAFHGEGTIGFSNATKEYETVWMDDMSTNMAFYRGTREGDVIRLQGEAHMPFGKLTTRDVYTKVSDDEYLYESYWNMPPEMGGETKVMEVRYTRVK